MVVCLSTCWWAKLWPSASDYCMLALNQWPLRRWYYWAYTYSFTALNHCVKDSSQNRAFLLLTGSVNKETGQDICLLRKLQIRCKSRHKKYKIKQFEISIVIMSCLLSLESRVTFHTRKSRGALWRENHVVKSDSVKWIHTVLQWQPTLISAFVFTIQYLLCRATKPTITPKTLLCHNNPVENGWFINTLMTRKQFIFQILKYYMGAVQGNVLQ